jgi:hypothetical protein
MHIIFVGDKASATVHYISPRAPLSSSHTHPVCLLLILLDVRQRGVVNGRKGGREKKIVIHVFGVIGKCEIASVLFDSIGIGCRHFDCVSLFLLY